MPSTDIYTTVKGLTAGPTVTVGIALERMPEMTVVPDGAIESATLIQEILLVQLAFLGLGILIWSVRLDKVALLLTSLALTLLVVEGTFRLLDLRGEYPRPRSDRVLLAPDGPTERAPHAFIPLSTVRSQYASNPRGYFDAGGVIDHAHNSAGWRDIEHSTEKPSDTFRILGLGDSYLWGQGVRYEDIVLTKLGALLEGDGHTIETINTGRNGANTVNQRDLFRDRGLQYDPDLIILFYVLNDVEQHLFEKRPKIEFFTNYTSLYQEADWLSNYSYFWGWAFQRFHATYTARQYVKQSVDTFLEDNTGWEQSRRALEEINQLAMAHGAPLLVVIFPFFTASTENMLFRSYTMRCEAIVNAPEFRSWTFATATVVTKVQNSGYTQLTNTQMRSPMRSQRTPLQSI